MRLTSSVAQTIIQSVELTSILVPSHRLRIMALLSSGCRATVEGLPNVRSSSTTHSGRDNCTCRVGRVQRIFISGQLKVIPLFRYSVIPYSAFYSVPQNPAHWLWPWVGDRTGTSLITWQVNPVPLPRQCGRSIDNKLQWNPYHLWWRAFTLVPTTSLFRTVHKKPLFRGHLSTPYKTAFEVPTVRKKYITNEWPPVNAA